MSKKVYVVTSGEYSDYQIMGIFSNLEKAEKYMSENTSDAYNGDYNDIQTHSLDSPRDRSERSCYKYSIWFSGKIEFDMFDTREEAHKSRRSVVKKCENFGNANPYDNDYVCAYASSFVSKEHGHKLAVELWQEHLRASGTK